MDGRDLFVTTSVLLVGVCGAELQASLTQLILHLLALKCANRSSSRHGRYRACFSGFKLLLLGAEIGQVEHLIESFRWLHWLYLDIRVIVGKIGRAWAENRIETIGQAL